MTSRCGPGGASTTSKAEGRPTVLKETLACADVGDVWEQERSTHGKSRERSSPLAPTTPNVTLRVGRKTRLHRSFLDYVIDRVPGRFQSFGQPEMSS